MARVLALIDVLPSLAGGDGFYCDKSLEELFVPPAADGIKHMYSISRHHLVEAWHAGSLL
jgi:hypothetical protein